MTKNEKGFSAVEGLLILVIAIVIGLVGWLVYQRQQTSKDQTNQQAIKNQTISEIIATVKDKVSKDVPAVKLTGAEEGNYNGYVSYKPAGYDYLSTVETKELVNYAPKNLAKLDTDSQEASARRQNEQTLSPVKDIVLNVLRENGFTEVTGYPTKEIIGDGGMYERAADLCAVNVNWLAVGISCATKDEFTKVAKEVKPFVEASRAAKVEEPSGTAFGLLDTGTGSTANDKYAILSTGFNGEYFYQENGKWVYFTSSQEGIDCTSTTNNAAAAKAFSKVCRKPGEGL